MGKIKSLDNLRKLREDLKVKNSLSSNNESSARLIRIKVAMATCSIASGSRETMRYMVDELEKRNIEALVTQTGCMGFCYAEPTVEITIPDLEPVIFGYVDRKKADQIIEKYIKEGELVDGIIPVNYRNVEDTVHD